MSEHLNFSLGGEPFEMTPDNASLFTFVGQGALYNHVFLVLEELEENHFKGTYVFSESPAYETLATFILENEYPAHINQRQPAACDLDAYMQYALNDLDKLDDGIPGDWQ